MRRASFYLAEAVPEPHRHNFTEISGRRFTMGYGTRYLGEVDEPWSASPQAAIVRAVEKRRFGLPPGGWR